MKNTVIITLIIFLLVNFEFLYSQKSPKNKSNSINYNRSNYPAVEIKDTELRLLKSKYVNQEYKIYISFPRNYFKTEKKYPVLYVLDAEYNFGCVAYIVRRLIKNEDIPELLVVGIAYDMEYEEFYGKRSRDLTPTVTNYRDDWESGGAEKFSQFIRNELFPFISTNYKTDNKNSTIVGHSYGGLFCLYALFKASDLFDNYLAVSPSLWYDHKIIFKYEEDYISKKKELDKNLYIASAEDEPNIPRDMLELREILKSRKYKGLRFKTVIEMGENHRSIFPISFTRGLRYIYERVEKNE